MLTILISLLIGAAPAPAPIDPAEDMGVECVLVSENPEVWVTSGNIPLPCGPSLDDLPVLDPIDAETGCAPAASSENCPGDISDEPIVIVEASAPAPIEEVVSNVQPALDVTPVKAERAFSQMIRYI